MSYEYLRYGRDHEVSEIADYALDLQDSITRDVTLSPDETYTKLLDAVNMLNDTVTDVYAGESVELSGSFWGPGLVEGRANPDIEVLASGYVYGVSNGFRLRSDRDDMSWLRGEGAEPVSQWEIGHSVYMGQTRHETSVGEEIVNCFAVGPLATSSLRRVADVNRQKHNLVSQVIDFNRQETEVLGTILIDMPHQERLRLIGEFFMALAGRMGAFHPMMNAYLRYVNHGLDLINQKAKISTAHAFGAGSTGFEVLDEEDYMGTAQGLCFVPTEALSSVVKFPYGTKQVLFLSLNADIAPGKRRNVLIPTESIVDYGFVTYNFS